MAEILTPKERPDQASSRESGPRPEQQAEQSPEHRREGGSEHAAESSAGIVVPPAVYIPQSQDERTHDDLKATPQDQQVAKLKHMALQEGALKAIFHAKKLKSPYVIDELHDALVDELRTQLFEEGKIDRIDN